jgi:cold shock CspA family protein
VRFTGLPHKADCQQGQRVAHPLQVSFLHTQAYDPAEEWVRGAVAKLDSICPTIINCRVVIEMPHREREWGNPYQVRIDISVPGKELVVMHDPDLHSTAQHLRLERKTKRLEVKDSHKNLHSAIHDAFKAARRKLQDYLRVRRREVKTHPAQPRARVSRLFPEKDYGILTMPDGREVYFHRNSVLRNGFERLRIGTEVTFNEEEGVKGPQASTVKPFQNHRASRHRRIGRAGPPTS